VRRCRLLAGAAIAAALATTTVTVATGATGAPAARTLPAVALLAAAAPVRYVALGDSYSSGTGAGDYGSSGSCERSANAYPEQWAAHHHTASFVSVACSGASTSAVLSGQLAALNAATTLVSISIGGNDAGFSSVMETCVLEWNSACLQAVLSAEAFIAGTLPGRLDATLRAIRAHAPSARVMVLGYPDLYDLSRSAGCIGLSTTKRTALNQGADQLDRALSAAAARNGDVFADVRGQFAGHEICDSSSWLYSVTFPIGDSYHPTAAGQELGYLPAFTSAAG
jgi:lysophospholipase L1-like esterase